MAVRAKSVNLTLLLATQDERETSGQKACSIPRF